MATLKLLYAHEYPVTDKIKIIIPSVGDVLDNEDSYYSQLSLLTSMPIDMMVQLDDMGIDFSKINEYELFLIMFPLLLSMDTHLMFGDLDLSLFERYINTKTEQPLLYDPVNDIKIDRVVHAQIAATLRKIHHLEKNRRKPANEDARKYLLERARIKAKRKTNKLDESQLETLIIAMVNTEQYKYDFESTKGLSIYQFNESVRQIIGKVDYEHRMHGIYSGTVDPKGLSQDELNWLTHK